MKYEFHPDAELELYEGDLAGDVSRKRLSIRVEEPRLLYVT